MSYAIFLVLLGILILGTALFGAFVMIAASLYGRSRSTRELTEEQAAEITSTWSINNH